MWLHSVSWIQVYKDGIETTTGVSKVQKERRRGRGLCGTRPCNQLDWLLLFSEGEGTTNQDMQGSRRIRQKQRTNKQTKQSNLPWHLQREAQGQLWLWLLETQLRLLAHSTLHLSSTLAVVVVTAAVGNWRTWISDVRSSFFPFPFMINFLNTQL